MGGSTIKEPANPLAARQVISNRLAQSPTLLSNHNNSSSSTMAPATISSTSSSWAEALPDLTKLRPPRASTVVKVVAAAVAVRLVWRCGKLVYNVLTSVPPHAALAHSCIPPKDWSMPAETDAATRAFIDQHYPDLLDLVNRGNLVALQPAAMLADLLQQQAKQRQQQQPGADFAVAVNDAALHAAEAPSFTEEDIAELLSSPQLQHCMANPAPPLLLFVGTVHVAKQSGDDVTRVIKVGTRR